MKDAAHVRVRGEKKTRSVCEVPPPDVLCQGCGCDIDCGSGLDTLGWTWRDADAGKGTNGAYVLVRRDRIAYVFFFCQNCGERFSNSAKDYDAFVARCEDKATALRKQA
jgi:hypothetical protein